MEAELTVRHEETNGRGAFFVERDGRRIAEQVYRRLGERRIRIVHTEVDPSLRRQGIARRLLDALVAWSRASETRVEASCSYARQQFERDASIKDVYDA
jgi:predicted GNAT family acetyltransferase